VLLSLSALAIICISPFIIVQLISENGNIALLNSTIIVVITSFFIFGYKTRKVDVARFYMSKFMMVAIIIDVFIKGSTPLYWFYPSVIAVYYLTSFKTAFIICLVSTVLLMIVIHPSVLSLLLFYSPTYCIILFHFLF
jgi:diguanylate cyclase